MTNYQDIVEIDLNNNDTYSEFIYIWDWYREETNGWYVLGDPSKCNGKNIKIELFTKMLVIINQWYKNRAIVWAKYWGVWI